LLFKWRAPELCESYFSGPGAPSISSKLTRRYERIVYLGIEPHEIYPKSVHEHSLRPELAGFSIAFPASCANSIMSSMTFLGCPVPVQSSTILGRFRIKLHATM